MSASLLATPVLYLSQDPDNITAQLQGLPLTRAEAGALREDISTDEITPIPILGNFDSRLGRYPYTGLKAGERLPIAPDAIRQAGIRTVVAGRRYGKGSSREHSPLAEVSASVRLVIAESFERIYRQNADNLGLYTSTDFSLLELLQRGEPIAVSVLLAGRDRLAASILQSGGLLQYGKQQMRHIVPLAPSALAQFEQQPQTYFEKIVARHAVGTDDTPPALQPGTGGFVRADWRFIHEYYTGMCMHMLDQAFDGQVKLHDPDSIIAFEDHLSYLHRSQVHQRQGLAGSLRELIEAHRTFVRRFGVPSHGALEEGEGSEGISHAVMTEKYALPGQVVVGTDSHTTHSGAVGCVAFGVGTTDMANSMVTGAVRLTMPESIRIELNGTLPVGVTAKDLVLHLLAAPPSRRAPAWGRCLNSPARRWRPCRPMNAPR